MQDAFLPVFLLVLCAIALAVGLLLAAGLVNSGRPNRVARMPYESGMDPIHDTRRRFDVRFHLLAIAFLVFDVELLFLYPWAVAMGGGERGMGTSVPIEVGGKSEIRNPKSEISDLKFQISDSSPLSPLPSPLSPDRHVVFGGVMVFLLLLTAGYVYDWRKGVFQWR